MDKHYFCTIDIIYIQTDLFAVSKTGGSKKCMETFKNPLTPDKEKEYINLCMEGDANARSALIEYNLRLVAHMVKKYSTSVRDPEDLLSIGTIGLIKAIDSYNPDKGCRLAGYAAKCIENELLMSYHGCHQCIRHLSS